MSLQALLLVVVLLIVLGALPVWPYSRQWSWPPIVTVVPVLLVLWALLGRGLRLG